MQKFSVIIPVYKLESPNFLSDALGSIINQSKVPSEIIIVVDGLIGKDLNNVIENLTSKNEIVIIRLKQSVGPGMARHAGILKSKHNIIALMDSDDLSRNNRFKEELDILINKDIDVVGGWIEEFNSKPGDLNRFRITPEKHDKIVSYSKWRMPSNHVTLVFKKEAYFKTGGYKSMRYLEDYDLVGRMLRTGIKFHNVQKVLVDVRVGNQMHDRRRGMSFLTPELKIFSDMYSSGYIGIWQYICNIFIRVVIRLLPSRIMSQLYTKLFRKSTHISSN